MHVVRSPVARAAAAIEAAPGTVEHAARGPGVLEQRLLLTGRFFRGVQGPSRPRKNLPESQGPDSDPVGLTFRNTCTSGNYARN